MSQYTKGPWVARKAEQAVNEQEYYIASDSGVIGYWKGGKSWHDDDQWVLTEQDAILIAAAPDLLHALQNIENDNGQIPDHAWKVIQDAIEKATTIQ
jgi:hypothetical protein